jgi:hypothetical protein
MKTIFFLTSLFCYYFWIRDPEWVKIGIRDKHPGSATLLATRGAPVSFRCRPVVDDCPVGSHAADRRKAQPCNITPENT